MQKAASMASVASMENIASMKSLESMASMENMASTLVWMIHALFVQIFKAKKHLCYFLRLLQLCLKRTFFPRVKQGVPLHFTPSKLEPLLIQGFAIFPKKHIMLNVEYF